MLALYSAFGILWLSTCIYAAWRGGWEGRWSAALFFVAALISPFAAQVAGPLHMKGLAMLTVDGSLLLALGRIAFLTNRYWPLWLVGLHLPSVAAELVALIDGRPLAHEYEAIQSFWSIPILLMMAIGVALDHRAVLSGRDGLGDESATENPAASKSAT